MLHDKIKFTIKLLYAKKVDKRTFFHLDVKSACIMMAVNHINSSQPHQRRSLCQIFHSRLKRALVSFCQQVRTHLHLNIVSKSKSGRQIHSTHRVDATERNVLSHLLFQSCHDNIYIYILPGCYSIKYLAVYFVDLSTQK